MGLHCYVKVVRWPWPSRGVGSMDSDDEPTAQPRRGRPKGRFYGHGWSCRRLPPGKIKELAAAASVGSFGSAAECAPEQAPEPPALIDESPVSLGALSRMRLIAHLLWSSCYDAIFKAELQENEAACGSDGQLVPTSYRARLKGERAEKYDHRRMIQRRDELAIRLHANNERHWSPSILARSMTYFLHTTAWQRHIEGRCVAVLALCAHAACCICACCYVRLYVLFNQCFACVQLL